MFPLPSVDYKEQHIGRSQFGAIRDQSTTKQRAEGHVPRRDKKRKILGKRGKDSAAVLQK